MKQKKFNSILEEKGLTITAIESVTGGLFMKSITEISGASIIFQGGLVTYSNESKIKLLGISEKLIYVHGVVSREVAEQMAIKGREIMGTDISVSFTGNAGPDYLEGKDRGLIFVGVSTDKETVVREFNLVGSRTAIQSESVERAKELILEIISK